VIRSKATDYLTGIKYKQSKENINYLPKGMKNQTWPYAVRVMVPAGYEK